MIKSGSFFDEQKQKHSTNETVLYNMLKKRSFFSQANLFSDPHGACHCGKERESFEYKGFR